MRTADAEPSYGECFVSLALGMAPFFLLLGIAAVFGADTVRPEAITYTG